MTSTEGRVVCVGSGSLLGFGFVGISVVVIVGGVSFADLMDSIDRG